MALSLLQNTSGHSRRCNVSGSWSMCKRAAWGIQNRWRVSSPVLRQFGYCHCRHCLCCAFFSPRAPGLVPFLLRFLFARRAAGPFSQPCLLASCKRGAGGGGGMRWWSYTTRSGRVGQLGNYSSSTKKTSRTQGLNFCWQSF